MPRASLQSTPELKAREWLIAFVTLDGDPVSEITATVVAYPQSTIRF